jgi:beta-lactam-binding protein with PASTA domain
MNGFKFLFSRVFLINFILALIVVLLISLLAFKMLDVYTMHDQAIQMPDFSGKTMEELEPYEKEYRFDFSVNDSVYDATKKPGSIVLQDPVPGSLVKKGRNIYLTLVSKLPEKVQMPDLQNLSLRQAVSLLETYGLLPGRLIFVPDPLVEHGTLVKKQLLNGDTLEADVQILKGSTIDLVVGKSADYTEVPVPLLIGLTQTEAIYTLNKAALNLGRVHTIDGQESDIFRVYQQNPVYSAQSFLSMGSVVDLWLKSELSFNYEVLRKNYEIPDTTQGYYDDESMMEFDSID